MTQLWILLSVFGGLSFLSGLLSGFSETESSFMTLQNVARTLSSWAQIMLGLLVAKHLGVW